jgi:hypothetical protein
MLGGSLVCQLLFYVWLCKVVWILDMQRSGVLQKNFISAWCNNIEMCKTSFIQKKLSSVVMVLVIYSLRFKLFIYRFDYSMLEI